MVCAHSFSPASSHFTQTLLVRFLRTSVCRDLKEVHRLKRVTRDLSTSFTALI